jgi:hypothetical protein
MKVLIGNYPYKHINFDSVLNNFDENCRFNCVLLNENNGKKCDELILCCHLYENVKKTFDWKNNSRTAQFDYLYSKYKHCYTKEYLYKFYQNFQPSQYKIGHIKKEKNEINKFLQAIKCPYSYKARIARTGFSKIIDELQKKNRIYLSHFTIDNKAMRYSNGVLKEQIVIESTGCHLYSKESETQIIMWLHENNYLDATLCMILDQKKLTFKTYGLKPSKFILDKFKHIDYDIMK